MDVVSLPQDVWRLSFAYLDWRDAGSAMRVCRFMHRTVWMARGGFAQRLGKNSRLKRVLPQLSELLGFSVAEVCSWLVLDSPSRSDLALLHTLTRLQSLDLRGSSVRENRLALHRLSQQELTRLRQLNLGRCSLTGSCLPSLTTLTNVWCLQLSVQTIQHEYLTVLTALAGLRDLRMTACLDISLDVMSLVGSLSCLTRLDMSDLRTQAIPNYCRPLQPLTQLLRLRLDEFPFQFIAPFLHMPNLEYLCSNIALDLSLHRNLTKLCIHARQLRFRLEDLPLLTRLRHLSISMSYGPIEYPSPCALDELWRMGRLQSLECIAFSPELFAQSAHALSCLTDLRILNLKRTPVILPINPLQPTNFPRLRQVTLPSGWTTDAVNGLADLQYCKPNEN